MSESIAEERAMKLGFDIASYGFNHDDLEKSGERNTREKLNTGGYGHPGLKEFSYVAAWLADKEFMRREVEARERNARERITLRAAKIANVLAIIAIIISVVGMAVNLDG